MLLVLNNYDNKEKKEHQRDEERYLELKLRGDVLIFMMNDDLSSIRNRRLMLLRLPNSIDNK